MYAQCDAVFVVTVFFSILQFSYTAVVQRPVQCCKTLQCSVVQCGTMQYNAVQCSAVQCSAVQCSAVQCSAVQRSAMQCSAVQCSAVWSLGRVLILSDVAPN